MIPIPVMEPLRSLSVILFCFAALGTLCPYSAAAAESKSFKSHK